MKVNFNKIAISLERENVINLITKFLQCKICMNILNDPYDCLCCNQTFCKSCITNYIKTHGCCPFEEFFSQNNNNSNNSVNSKISNNLKPSSSNFLKVIQSLKFYCKYNKNGCNQTFCIEDIVEHEKTCKYKNKKITNNNTRNYKHSENSAIYTGNNFTNNHHSNNYNFNSCSNIVNTQDSFVSFKGLEYFQSNNQNNNNNNSIIQNNNIIYGNEKIEKTLEEINQKINFLWDNNYSNNARKSSSQIIDGSSVIINKSDLNDETGILSNNKNEDSSSIIYNLDNSSNKIASLKEIKVKLSKKYLNKDNTSPKTFINNNIPATTKNADLQHFYNNINNNNNPLNNTINTSQNPHYKFFTRLNKYKLLKSNTKKTKVKSPENRQIIDPNLHKTMQYPKKIFTNIEKLNSKKNFEKNNNIINNNNSNPNRSKLLAKRLSSSTCSTKQIGINTSSNDTPKLGIKKKADTDIKSLDLNIENNNKEEKILNNDIVSNEDIKNCVNDMNKKITDIERLLQTNVSITGQTYSIVQNNPEDNKITTLNSIDVNSNNTNNKNEKQNNDNVENVNIINNVEEIIKDSNIKIEEYINNKLDKKLDDFKNYFEQKCLEDIKSCILETNLDIANLYSQKFDELEELLKSKKEKKESVKDGDNKKEKGADDKK